MISSMHVPICNVFHVRRANSGKISGFYPPRIWNQNWAQLPPVMGSVFPTFDSSFPLYFVIALIDVYVCSPPCIYGVDTWTVKIYV